MRSVYAVVAQMTVAASNYLAFIVFARRLDAAAFVGYSTAVGLGLMAAAIAEGGVSYVAPRDLANAAGRREGKLAGAFLSLILSIYAVVTIGGFLLWNALASDGLDPAWVSNYALFALSALLVPSWLTCWSLDLLGAIVIGAARFALVVAVAVRPEATTLAGSGIAFMLIVAWIYGRLNRDTRVVAWPDGNAMSAAAHRLREVFLSKTLSYGAYGMIPMIVGVSRGPLASAQYVTGERLKALYSTLFQPLVDSAYLAQFKSQGAARSRFLEPLVHVANVLFVLGVMLAARRGGFGLLGERFQDVPSLPVFLLAGAASVASAALLYFRVFPSGTFQIFRIATAAQLVAFLGAFAWIWIVPTAGVAWILGIAEGVLLATLLVSVAARGGLARGAILQTTAERAHKGHT